MTTTTNVRPSWYTDDDDTAWEKVKAAFQRDWKQTQHDFGGSQPDLDQHVGDTITQATGTKPIPPGNVPTPHPDESDSYNDADEPAYRYGYAASRYFADRSEWDIETEKLLQKDWSDPQEWQQRRAAVRRGWRYHRAQSNPSSFKTV